MLKWVLALLFLNSADALLTAYSVVVGFATEINPITAFLIAVGIWLFILVKLLLVNLFVGLVAYLGRNYKITHTSIVCVTYLYCILLVYHVLGIASSLIR